MDELCAVQQRLDDTLGFNCWSEEYEVVSGKEVVCRLEVVKPGGEVVTAKASGKTSVWSKSLCPLRDAFADGLRNAANELNLLDEFSRHEAVRLERFPGHLALANGTLWSQWQQGRWKQVLKGFHKLKAPNDSRGYQQVSLLDRSGRRVHGAVHRFIAEAFHGTKPSGSLVRHLDGCRTDCRPENLAYGTYQDNAEDTIRHRRTVRGERSATAKLTWVSVAEIRSRVMAGELQKDVAVEYGVSKATVSAIMAMKSWVPFSTEVNDVK